MKRSLFACTALALCLPAAGFAVSGTTVVPPPVKTQPDVTMPTVPPTVATPSVTTPPATTPQVVTRPSDYGPRFKLSCSGFGKCGDALAAGMYEYWNFICAIQTMKAPNTRTALRECMSRSATSDLLSFRGFALGSAMGIGGYPKIPVPKASSSITLDCREGYMSCRGKLIDWLVGEILLSCSKEKPKNQQKCIGNQVINATEGPWKTLNKSISKIK